MATMHPICSEGSEGTSVYGYDFENTVQRKHVQEPTLRSTLCLFKCKVFAHYFSSNMHREFMPGEKYYLQLIAVNVNKKKTLTCSYTVVFFD